ncbi:MAG: AI-2E family transporter [Myxococcaceae bacterium]
MSAPPPPIATKPSFSVSSLLTALVVVGILALAKSVLIPFALAFYLAFVLTPPLKMLERMGVPRIFSVFITVSLMLTVLGGLGLVLAYQADDLSTQLAKYTTSMRRKVVDLRNGRSGPLALLESTVNRLSEDLNEKNTDVKSAAPVRIVPGPSTARDRLQTVAAPLLRGLAFFGIVLVLVVFMLSRREDLRDRLIRLVGRGRVTLATRTMDEAVQRISRFLLALSLINTAYGVIVAAGLGFIGVPYALLWGFLAGALRFVPYVGSLLAAAIPTLLAFAMFPGWTQVLQTVALFITIDVLVAYFAEPLLVGHRTGVSSLALLVSGIFWAWLWGPIGLVLSTPLTVCVAVLGRHVEKLAFLNVLLGDQEALEMDIRFYQRLLAKDEGEAAGLALQVWREKGWMAAMDEVLLPALSLAAQDRDRNEISAEDFAKVQATTRNVLRRLERAQKKQLPAKAQTEPIHAVGVAAHTSADSLLLELLRPTLRLVNAELRIIDRDSDPEHVMRDVVNSQPRFIFIASLPPAGGAKARFLCRKLKTQLPNASLTVLRPANESDDPARSSAALREAGADGVITTMAAAQVAWPQISATLVKTRI